jgi:hypothetical protein
MIKVGDRVTLFRNMSKEGIVVEIKERDSKTWMVGGVSSKILMAVIKLDEDQTLEEHFTQDLMRLD